MISVQGLRKGFGRHQALRGISFEVAVGELVGFVGLNGAGKTTTMRLLSGYLQADEGRVQIAGHCLPDEREAACAQLGYMAEGAPMHEEMRVREFLMYRARLKGLSRARAAKRIETLADDLELREVLARLVGRLSKGFRQRVALADALVSDPPVLLLDEPMSGLDPLQRRSFRELLQTSTASRCVLFSSHVLPEVEAIATRFIVLHRGEVIADADRAGLRAAAGLGSDASADDVFAKLVEA